MITSKSNYDPGVEVAEDSRPVAIARAAPVEPAVLPTYPGRGLPASPPMMEGRTMATGNAVLW